MEPERLARIQHCIDALRVGAIASAIVCCVGDARVVLRASIGERRVDGALDDFLRRRETTMSNVEPGGSRPLRDSLPPGHQVLVTLDREVCLIGVFPKEVDAWFATSRMRLVGRRVNELLAKKAVSSNEPGGSAPASAEALAFEPEPITRRRQGTPSDWAPEDDLLS